MIPFPPPTFRAQLRLALALWQTWIFVILPLGALVGYLVTWAVGG